MSHGKNRCLQRKRAKQRRIKALFDKQGGKCFYCQHPMRLVAPSREAQDACTIDHKRARAMGGGGGLKNLVAACARCNARKGCSHSAVNFALIAPAFPPPYARLAA